MVLIVILSSSYFSSIIDVIFNGGKTGREGKSNNMEIQKKDRKFFVAVKAIIFNANENNKFLIIKRSDKVRTDNFMWDFPGGRLEFSEKPLEALEREIREETGLTDVVIGDPINLWTFMKDEQTQIIGVTYLCKNSSQEVILSDEHLEYRWISKEEVPNYNICEGMVNDMKKWNWNELYEKLTK